jgi:hypothetical protein
MPPEAHPQRGSCPALPPRTQDRNRKPASACSCRPSRLRRLPSHVRAAALTAEQRRHARPACLSWPGRRVLARRRARQAAARAAQRGQRRVRVRGRARFVSVAPRQRGGFSCAASETTCWTRMHASLGQAHEASWPRTLPALLACAMLCLRRGGQQRRKAGERISSHCTRIFAARPGCAFTARQRRAGPARCPRR